MTATSELTLGHIAYLNCVPFFGRLRESGFQGHFVSGVPSALNRMLQEKILDASPSSSFEYASHWRDYLLLPGHSIASVEEVRSVALFSPVDPKELEGQDVFLTGESATSVNLLRILFREFYGLHDVRDKVPEGPVEALIEAGKPALLIGDRALKLANNLPAGVYFYDLGNLWYEQTGLPFVFALWMVRRNSLEPFRSQLKALGGQLQQSRDEVLKQPGSFAVQASAETGLPEDVIIDYWKTIDYRLDEPHLRGLKLFFQLCNKHQLLEDVPELNFLT